MNSIQVFDGDGERPGGCHPPGSTRIFARNVTDESPVGYLLVKPNGHPVFVDDPEQATIWEAGSAAERLKKRLSQTHQQFTYELVMVVSVG